jgi:DNA-binding response OmpR family regulator
MKKTILVVDDDASVRESVENVLKGAGYGSVQAAGGLQAPAKFDSHSIDLVILDIGHPHQDDWQTCVHLARRHSDVPIIVTTREPGQFSAALASGAAALMEKPLDADELLQTVQILLGRTKESDPLRTGEKFYYVAHDPRSSCEVR